MAFTLLGTGTVVTKSVAPQFDNFITAEAACKHKVSASSWSDWKWFKETWPSAGVWREHYKRTCKCKKCGATLQTQKKYEEYTYGTTWYGAIIAEYLRTVYY